MKNHIKPETRNSLADTLGEPRGQPSGRLGQAKLETLFRDSRGTTLIEVLMASVIFMIGMLALLGMQVTAMHSNKIGGEITEATYLVSDEIERLWAVDLTAADLAVGTHNDPNNPVDLHGQAGGKYTRQWIVTGDAANTNSRFIRVRVTWGDVWAKARQVQFTFAR